MFWKLGSIIGSLGAFLLMVFVPESIELPLDRAFALVVLWLMGIIFGREVLP